MCTSSTCQEAVTYLKIIFTIYKSLLSIHTTINNDNLSEYDTTVACASMRTKRIVDLLSVLF